MRTFADDASTAPWHIGRRLPPGMRELNAADGAVRFDERHDAPECIGMLLRPDPAVPRCDATLGGDAARLDHDQSRAADGAAAEVHEVPAVWESVVARVLA